MEYHFIRQNSFRNNYFYKIFDILDMLQRGINYLHVIEIRLEIKSTERLLRHCWLGEGSKTKVAGIIIGQAWHNISHLFHTYAIKVIQLPENWVSATFDFDPNSVCQAVILL